MKKVLQKKKSNETKVPIDNSFLFLLFSNILTIIFALRQDINLISIMWIYWVQSVTIGIIFYFKIKKYDNFYPADYFINKENKNNDYIYLCSEENKNHDAKFLLMHYGFFHFGYFIFLLFFTETNIIPHQKLNWIFIILLSLVFIFNHLFSFYNNFKKDNAKKKSLNTYFIFPYARILPLHMTIILAAAFPHASIILFLSLKTIADLIMHQIEHRL